MKTLKSQRVIAVPKGVEVVIKARKVYVKGPRGELTRTFKHQNLDICLEGASMASEDAKVTVTKWFGKRKEIACIRTISAHIENMITGVTQGFRYKMRFVYAHFPINVTIKDDPSRSNASNVEIRNFLGEKRVRIVPMASGVQVVRSSDVKDQLVFEGNDINAVSQSCADIFCATRVREKDIRKFLDGIYVSEKGPIPKPQD